MKHILNILGVFLICYSLSYLIADNGLKYFGTEAYPFLMPICFGIGLFLPKYLLKLLY